MKSLLTILGVSFIIIVNSGCPKPCIESNYSFAVNSQMVPDLDSIQVGDTIFLVSSFPSKLTDLANGRVVDYSNSTGIGSTLGIVKLINGTYPGLDAVSEFNYLSEIGMIYNDSNIPSPNKFQQLRYQEDNGSYNLKIGIVPKQKGIYYLGIGDGLSNGRTKSKNCENGSFKIVLLNTDQHLNFFTSWSPGNSLSSYEESRAYFFKVY